jgi:PKD repeat protein
MKQIYILFLSFIFTHTVFSQLYAPSAVSTNQEFIWGESTNRSAVDSCETYFNNYVGLAKTSQLRIERMRVGNAVESSQYNGRAQKFIAPQPIEVSGVEFYAFIDNQPSVDSLMVITTLNNFDTTNDTIGTELARDTVYVSHNSFNPLFDPLPSIAVQSEFDMPIIVTSDYMITVYTPTDDSLRIIANDPTINEGDGEGLGYALYENPNYPSFIGWYDMLIDFAADYDFLLSPRITYKKPTDFLLSDTVLCPNSNPVCLTYSPIAMQSFRQYNSNFENPQSTMSIIWGNSNFDNDTVFACHTYLTPGTYTVNFLDTIKVWDFNNPNCTVDISKTVTVNDSIEISFTSNQTGFDVDFSTTAVNVDSVWWDFGDNSGGTDDLNPSHTYPGFGTYNVWLYAFNDCMTKSLFTTLIIQPNTIGTNDMIDISLYPNPANQFILLSGVINNCKITIFNIAGKTVLSESNINEKSKIDISHLNNGTYFVRIESTDRTITKKLAIKH